ncbi:MAG: YigZ family protein [Bacilli bacterium]|nr:YigZ family protein [Bacilli bacterium]
MKKIKESFIEIKKSKFIGIYYEVNNIEEVNTILDELKKEHKKARHIPYAYKIGPLAKKTDDKEPSNTAGLPIYNIIERKNLDNCLIVVIRYFGGTKLGAGPLLRAYSEAANEATKDL